MKKKTAPKPETKLMNPLIEGILQGIKVPFACKEDTWHNPFTEEGKFLRVLLHAAESGDRQIAGGLRQELQADYLRILNASERLRERIVRHNKKKAGLLRGGFTCSKCFQWQARRGAGGHCKHCDALIENK